jgi:hypothetical protein
MLVLRRRYALFFVPLVLSPLSMAAPRHDGPWPAAADRLRDAAHERRYRSIDEVPESARKAAEAFAQELEADIRSGDTRAVVDAFDLAAVTDAIVRGVSSSSRQLDDFKTGMRKGLLSSVTLLAETWPQEQPKFKRLVICDGRLAARFRFVAESGGISIIDLHIRETSPGRLAVEDFYNQAFGVGLVASIRQASMPLLAELDQGFLERLFASPNYTKADIESFAEMAQSMRTGEFARVTAIFKRLPPSLKSTDAAIAMNLTALQSSGDDEAYKSALRDAAETTKSASFKFMLVDLYFLEQNYAKAVECLDEFMAAVEPDAALLATRALIQMEQGAVSAAMQSLRSAFELEPDCEHAHAAGLDVLLAGRDFAGVRNSMLFLEEQCGYAFEDLSDPLWKEFLQAPESAAWR